jgi:predicted AAA+ superfamily ATPase
LVDNLPNSGKISFMFKRHILSTVLEALADTPVVFIRGARQTGKSTLVQEVARTHHPARYVTLDNAVILSAASSNPSGFLSNIDELVKSLSHITI